HHPVGRVGLLLDSVVTRGRREGRPAAARVVLRVGVEQLRAAPGAAVAARLEDVIVLATKRRLGSLLPQDAVLLGRQLLAPLLLGLLDFAHASSVAVREVPPTGFEPVLRP